MKRKLNELEKLTLFFVSGFFATTHIAFCYYHSCFVFVTVSDVDTMDSLIMTAQSPTFFVSCLFFYVYIFLVHHFDSVDDDNPIQLE